MNKGDNMINEQLYQEKIKKVKAVIEIFLNDKKTIKEVSEETNISKSSIQRYLNDTEIINEIYGKDAVYIIQEIQKKLNENIEEGKRTGGLNFAKNNEALKDESGHFIGSKKKEKSDIEKEAKLYVLVANIALEFRVSLNNLCKLIGKEDNEQNRLYIYQKIVEYVIKKDSDLTSQYNYLFFHETLNEPKNISNNSYNKVIEYLKRRKKAIKSGNREELIKISRELKKTEIDFAILLKKNKSESLSDEDINTIAKYRIKRCLTQKKFYINYNLISRSNLSKREKMIESEDLKYKINILNEYFYDIGKKQIRHR